MTPPHPKPQTQNPLRLDLGAPCPAPPKAQKNTPVSGKVEMDANGNATYLISFDLSFLLNGTAGAKAAKGAARADAKRASAAAGRAARGLLPPSPASAAKPAAPSLETLGDGLIRGLRNLFGPPADWMSELAEAVGF